MGNRIKKALREMMNWIMSDDYAIASDPCNSKYGNSPSPIRIHGGSLDQFNNGIDFTIFKAIGGKIVRIHNYDPKTDRHTSELYLITDKEDFGAELSQIITRDSLTR